MRPIVDDYLMGFALLNGLAFLSGFLFHYLLSRRDYKCEPDESPLLGLVDKIRDERMRALGERMKISGVHRVEVDRCRFERNGAVWILNPMSIRLCPECSHVSEGIPTRPMCSTDLSKLEEGNL